MAVVDESSVQLVADSTGLAAEIRREVQAALAAATAGQSTKVTVELDFDQGALARMQVALRRLEYQQINPMLLRFRTKINLLYLFLQQKIKLLFDKLKLRLTQAKLQVQQLERALKALGDVSIDIDVDTADALAKLQALRDLAKDIRVEIKVDLDDVVEALTQLAALKAAAEDIKVKVSVTGTAAVKRMTEQLEKLDDLRKRFVDPIEVKVDVDVAAIAELRKLASALQRIEKVKDVRIHVEVTGTAAALAELQKLVAHIRFLTGKTHRIRVKVDVDGDADLTRLIRRLGDADRSGRRAGGSMRALSGAFSGLLGIVRGLGTIFGGLVQGMLRMGGASSTLTQGMTMLKGGVAGVASAAPALLAAMAAIGGATYAVVMAIQALMFILGALGAALLALPAVITGVGAAVGVAALAFQNFGDAIKEANTPEEIKKQQEALAKLHPEARKVATIFNNELRPAFDGFQKEIQGRFFQGLDEPFRQLVTTINGALKPGLLAVTDSVNAFVKQLLGIVTGEEGIRRVNNALVAAKSFLDQLLPAVGNLVRAFLDLAGVEPIARNIGGAFSDVLGHVTNFLDVMRTTPSVVVPGMSEAEAAVAALRGVLSTLTGTFMEVLRSATNLFTQAAPGFNNLVREVGGLASSLTSGLAGAFNTALQAGADFIRSIPPESLDAFKQAIGDVSTAMQSFANSPAAGQIVDAITGCINTFRDFIALVDGISTGIGKVQDAFTTLRGKIGQADEALGTSTETSRRWVREYEQNLAEKAPQAADTFADRSTDALNRAADAAPPAGERLVNGIKIPLEKLPGITQTEIDKMTPEVREGLKRAVEASDQEIRNLPPTVQAPMSEIPGITQAELAKVTPEVRDAWLKAARETEAGAAGIPEAAKPPLEGMPGEAGDAVAPTGPAIQGEIDKAAQSAGTAGKGVVDALVAALGVAPDTVRQALSGVNQAVRTSLDGASSQATTAGANIVRAFETALGEATAATERALGPVGDTVDRALNGASSRATEAGAKIVQALGKELEKAGEAARTALGTQVPDAVRAALAAAIMEATTGATGIVNAVRGGLSGVGPAAAEGMRGLPDAVRQACAAAAAAMRDGVAAIVAAANFEGVAASAETAMVRIPTAVQTNMTAAVGHAQAGGQQILTAVMTSMDLAAVATEQGWQRIVQACQTGGQQSVQIAQQTGQQIVAVFEQLGPAMQQAGMNMMLMLAQGIQQGGQQAIAAAQQVAQAIQGLFPMSPAKWGPLSGQGDPQRLGANVGERIADGLEGQNQNIAAAITPALSAIAGSLDQASPAQRAAAVSATASAPVAASPARSSAPAPTTAGATRFSDLSPEDAFALLRAAVRGGVDGAELSTRDDGRGGRTTITNRDNRRRTRMGAR